MSVASKLLELIPRADIRLADLEPLGVTPLEAVTEMLSLARMGGNPSSCLSCISC